MMDHLTDLTCEDCVFRVLQRSVAISGACHVLSSRKALRFFGRGWNWVQVAPGQQIGT